ncbi:hypothetical protein [Halopiger djelfimassiliensis]|uniref:hypothetical protein n=1 Tax=Halopiger djelfimassiliensis TaxID=1293047 RepID=UPI0012B5ABD1|nr:hypothetical protein [Halopiger djelfimassiliensis]
MNVSRRVVLATTAGLTASGSGCLNDSDTSDEPSDSEEPNDEPAGSADREPVERWVPASSDEPTVFNYVDATTVRAREDDLGRETIDALRLEPREPTGTVLDRFEDPTVEYVLEFGPEYDVSTHVIGGAFDPTVLEAWPLEEEIDEFERYEPAEPAVDVAVSESTLVVVDPDVGNIDDVLDAGTDGDRHVDDRFETVLEQVGDDHLSSGITAETLGDKEVAVGQSWSLGTEAATLTICVASSDEPPAADDFEGVLDGYPYADPVDEFTVEIDGSAAVATGTAPIAELETIDLFAERQRSVGQEAQAGVDIDVDPTTREVTVMYTSAGNTDFVEIKTESGRETTLSEVGETRTLEYEDGVSDTVLVIAVAGDTRTQILSEDVSF